MLRAAFPLLLLAGAVSAEPPVPRCEADAGRRANQVHGEVRKGEAFTQATAEGWVLRLLPVSEGWLLIVTTEDRPDEDLAQLTPPWHFTPNPRQIEGWHFRNADNTGPNDGSVNAPQELREFIFSPLVNREIQGADATRGPTAEEVKEVGSFGRGWFFIAAYRLTPIREGERAAFESIRFSACLTWPG